MKIKGESLALYVEHFMSSIGEMWEREGAAREARERQGLS